MSGIDDIALNFSPASLLVLNAILAVVMFSIAIDLKPADFQALARAPKPLAVGLISQFLVLPALTFLLVLAVQPRPSVALGLILVAACPGGNISNFITYRAGGNAALSVSMTALATVGAILLTPLNIAFWAGMYEPTRALLRDRSPPGGGTRPESSGAPLSRRGRRRHFAPVSPSAHRRWPW